MSISYDHSQNVHTLAGPKAALSILFADAVPTSLLDVGCGTGTWLKAATEIGVPDVLGVDGVEVPADQLHVPAEKVQRQDLTRPWKLNKRFDVVICLEVAEHLDSDFAPTLVDALVQHGERIYFSAACPGQIGQHHVNCRWPAYWQQLFNKHGYVCEDSVRWKIWDDPRIEPWYRQNLFFVHRAPEMAGQESRIRPVIHPEIWHLAMSAPPPPTFEEIVAQIEQGRMPIAWNLTIPQRALWAKWIRRLR